MQAQGLGSSFPSVPMPAGPPLNEIRVGTKYCGEVIVQTRAQTMQQVRMRLKELNLAGPNDIIAVSIMSETSPGQFNRTLWCPWDGATLPEDCIVQIFQGKSSRLGLPSLFCLDFQASKHSKCQQSILSMTNLLELQIPLQHVHPGCC